MQIGLVNAVSSITNGEGALQSARINADGSRFSDLIDRLQSRSESSVKSANIAKEGRLNGDIATGFENSFSSKTDKNALPKGAAANQANSHVKSKNIDRTSKLYEKSMELESFFVKQMLSSMRKTVTKSALNAGGLAGDMYEDMLFDEYAVSMTKNAGFGLADQIYLSLV